MLRDLGKRQKAVENLEAALKKDEENVLALILLGEVRRDERDLEAAQVQFARALKVDPANTVAQ